MIQSLKIAPSILSADFAHLAEEVHRAEIAGADYIHIDVMDGNFVPNITFGPTVVRAVRGVTDLPLDVHLMIDDPARYVADFAAAGASGLTVHIESTPHAHRVIQQIRDLDVKPGITLNPATPSCALTEILCDVDLVLVMTVNPGFGGQTFIQRTLEKITQIRQMLDAIGSNAELEVDGGISPITAEMVVCAGARVLVAGAAVFRAPEGVSWAVNAIRQAGSRGLSTKTNSQCKNPRS
jgi:ribulose-phosphate 3-epimerase